MAPWLGSTETIMAGEALELQYENHCIARRIHMPVQDA